MEIRQLSQLIGYVVSLVNDMDGYVTTIRLVKFLYLIDLEYFRIRRKTLTGLNWIFHLYGPYAFEIPEAGRALGYNLEREELSTSSSHNGVMFHTIENYQSPNWLDFTSQSIIERILKVWNDQDTPTLLDYVYNQTEPMSSGKRGKPLNFSLVNPGTRYYNFEINVDQKFKTNLVASLRENNIEESEYLLPVSINIDTIYSESISSVLEEDNEQDYSGVFFENHDLISE